MFSLRLGSVGRGRCPPASDALAVSRRTMWSLRLETTPLPLSHLLTDGDTRHPGALSLAWLKVRQPGGRRRPAHHELPDHLPVVLEFGAPVDEDSDCELLHEHRPPLDAADGLLWTTPHALRRRRGGDLGDPARAVGE